MLFTPKQNRFNVKLEIFMPTSIEFELDQLELNDQTWIFVYSGTAKCLLNDYYGLRKDQMPVVNKFLNASTTPLFNLKILDLLRLIIPWWQFIGQ